MPMVRRGRRLWRQIIAIPPVRKRAIRAGHYNSVSDGNQ